MHNDIQVIEFLFLLRTNLIWLIGSLISQFKNVYTTCQRADELIASQRPSCRSGWGVATHQGLILRIVKIHTMKNSSITNRSLGFKACSSAEAALDYEQPLFSSWVHRAAEKPLFSLVLLRLIFRAPAFAMSFLRLDELMQLKGKNRDC